MIQTSISTNNEPENTWSYSQQMSKPPRQNFISEKSNLFESSWLYRFDMKQQLIPALDLYLQLHNHVHIF